MYYNKTPEEIFPKRSKFTPIMVQAIDQRVHELICERMGDKMKPVPHGEYWVDGSDLEELKDVTKAAYAEVMSQFETQKGE